MSKATKQRLTVAGLTSELAGLTATNPDEWSDPRDMPAVREFEECKVAETRLAELEREAAELLETIENTERRALEQRDRREHRLEAVLAGQSAVAALADAPAVDLDATRRALRLVREAIEHQRRTVAQVQRTVRRALAEQWAGEYRKRVRALAQAAVTLSLASADEFRAECFARGVEFDGVVAGMPLPFGNIGVHRDPRTGAETAADSTSKLGRWLTELLQFEYATGQELVAWGVPVPVVTELEANARPRS